MVSIATSFRRRFVSVSWSKDLFLYCVAKVSPFRRRFGDVLSPFRRRYRRYKALS